MSDVPLRGLMISDFRRIEGTRELPLDAPVVLIHGPNGTGKTSILSALELALTGGIRSMERHSDHYRAHLPFFGQPYATVQAKVAPNLQAGTPGSPLTVSGARTEGAPAFNHAAAKFYSERCYLDQSSLGRLLDLYQARAGSEQTALEKFVNELLGLEKLDALLDGLSDATDLRLLKKLAPGVEEADREAKNAGAALSQQSAVYAAARADVINARAAVQAAIARLDVPTAQGMGDEAMIAFLESTLADDADHSKSIAAAVALHQEVIALSGRVTALAERPTMRKMHEIRADLMAARADQEAWVTTDGVKVQEWESAAIAAGAELRGDPRIAVEYSMRLVSNLLENASVVRADAETVRKQLEADQSEFDAARNRLDEAHEHSSALVESLAALRPVIGSSNICPVCNRDFTETGHDSLLVHVDARMAELTSQSQKLVKLREERDILAGRIARRQDDYTNLTARLLSPDQQRAVEERHAALVKLAGRADEIDHARSTGAALNDRVRDLERSLKDLEAAVSEAHHVSDELVKYAARLQVSLPLPSEDFGAASRQLRQLAEARIARLAEEATQYRNARSEVGRLKDAIEQEFSAAQSLARIAENKKEWDDRVVEARRRQGIAREVRDAATQARTSIVHRVFTESLNDVWRRVFTRLAPDEEFIPSFGIPNATKKTFDIRLETTHRNGGSSGPPQMMLSAGNLNTAALSLFLALHLAVEPIVPCLVFDDPVQAMDEVHVAQFAALVRLLSKQNRRQVIIAVHERELFDYLALELSPAYEGDELLTIELSEGANRGDEGITRHIWAPDLAIAD